MPRDHRLRALTMRTHVTTEIRFGRGGNAADFLRIGWSGPEETWNWTDGRRAELEFNAPEAPFGYYVEIETTAFILWPERPCQPVIVFADGQCVAVLAVGLGGIFAIFCPKPTGPRVTLAFDLPGATRMSEIRGTGDRRELALAVNRVRIMPLLEPYRRPSLEPLTAVIDEETIAEAVNRTQRATGVAIHELLTRFELICGDCSFGLMQRALGSDPLSLLRFAGASAKLAIHGLDTEFRHLGQALSATPAADGSGEWMVVDPAGLNYHSGQPLSVTSGDVVAAERKKIAFLREKLLRDLSEGSKVFLFTDFIGQPPEAAMSIFLALRRVSSARMLWVREAPFGEQAGSTREIAPGLFLGLMDRSSPFVDGMPIGGWLSVLASAHVLIARLYPPPRYVGFTEPARPEWVAPSTTQAEFRTIDLSSGPGVRLEGLRFVRRAPPSSG